MSGLLKRPHQLCPSCIGSGEEAMEIPHGEEFQTVLGDCRACNGGGFELQVLRVAANHSMSASLELAVLAIENVFGKRKAV